MRIFVSFSVYPRVMFENVPDRQLQKMFINGKTRGAVSSLLINACFKYGFQGVVLESWFQLAGRYHENDLLILVEGIGKRITLKSIATRCKL